MSDTENRAYKVRENRARRWATRQGLVLRKSRAQRLSVDDFGGYMLIDGQFNALVAGQRFDLSLDDVEEFLKEGDEELEKMAPSGSSLTEKVGTE